MVFVVNVTSNPNACLREAVVARSDIKLTSKTKLSFNQILISRLRYISYSKKPVITHVAI